jgi:hypothetical protein
MTGKFHFNLDFKEIFYLIKFNIMKELSETFIGRGQVKGFAFTQIEKSASAYIYEVNTGNSKFYEVFKRIENTRFMCVSYPTNNAFGVWAWTFGTLKRAEDKFDELELLFESKIGL